MQVKFTIHGNHEDPEGNPVPYLRMTRNQYWKPTVQRYKAWKEYVRAVFWNEAKHELPNARRLKRYPIESGDGLRMEIKIYWKNKAHADPDNVWKGIADALFEQDKNLDGSFESQVAKDKKGRVEVVIKSNPKTRLHKRI